MSSAPDVLQEWRDLTAGWWSMVGGWWFLKSQQPRDFDGEGLVQETGVAGGRGISAVAVDDEQLAAGCVFPAHACARGKRMRGGVVLHEAAEAEAGGGGDHESSARETGDEVAEGQVDPIDRDVRFRGYVRRETHSPAEADRAAG